MVWVSWERMSCGQFWAGVVVVVVLLVLDCGAMGWFAMGWFNLKSSSNPRNNFHSSRRLNWVPRTASSRQRVWKWRETNRFRI